MNLFEDKSYRLKDGRSVIVKISTDYEETRYGDDDEFELSEEMLDVTAYLGHNAVGHGKFDVEAGSFRGIEVFEKYRRMGVATAMYDELKRLGYHVRPSDNLEPDGEKFWAARRKVTESPNDPVAVMTQEILQATDAIENEIEKGGMRVHEGDWELIFRPADGAVELHMIKIHFSVRKQGTGTMLMKLICDAADRNGIKLVLTASNDEGNWLEDWYQGFGFTKIGKTRYGPKMARNPKGVITEEAQWSPELLDTLHSWQLNSDFEGAFTNSRHGWQQQLIDFMKRNPHHVDGMLYRASRTADETAEKIMAGDQAVHKKLGSLLESWSKTRQGALDYFDSQRDMHSIVVMEIPASSLQVVCDLDQVPFDVGDLYRVEQHEVLVLAEDRLLDCDNTIAALHYNYEEDIETEGWSPYTNVVVTRHRDQ